MEIERKWLIKTEDMIDWLSQSTVYTYSQAYLSVNPEVRIRAKKFVALEAEATYMLTIKGKGLLSRIEVEKELTYEEFCDLMEVADIKIEDFIHSVIYEIFYLGHQVTMKCVDVTRASRFSYVEIEFNSEEEAFAFVAPDWFLLEVTNEPAYKMKNYWANICPHLVPQGG
jgi:adenylate cyclase